MPIKLCRLIQKGVLGVLLDNSGMSDTKSISKFMLRLTERSGDVDILLFGVSGSYLAYIAPFVTIVCISHCVDKVRIVLMMELLMLCAVKD